MNAALIVFDLAGTTVKDNRDAHRVLQSVMAKFDIDISLEDANEVRGIPKPVAIRTLLLKYGFSKLSDKLIDEIHAVFVNEMIRFYQFDASVGEKDGVSDTFRRLKEKNIKIAVDTGLDRPIAVPLLERLGWIKNQLIDCSVTSDEVDQGKPFPDLVYKAMELTHVTDASRVIKVGDTPFDLQEGSAAGCGMVIGITSGAFSHEVLSKEPHSYLLEQVSEILSLSELQ